MTKSRNELYTEIVDLIKFRDMALIRLEMAKRYRGITQVHALNMEQLNDWAVHLRSFILRGGCGAQRLPTKCG